MFKKFTVLFVAVLMAFSATFALGCKKEDGSQVTPKPEPPTIVEVEVDCNLEIEKDIIYVAAGDKTKVDIAEFTVDGKNANLSLLEYSSENEDVFTVDEKGTITAVNCGTSYVCVAYQGVTAKTRVEVGVSRNSLKEFASDAVKIHGRHTKNEAGALVFDNVNSGIELWFFGTECKVAFDVNETDSIAGGLTQYGFLRAYLDDEIKYGYENDIEELNVAGRRVALDKAGKGVVYTLASGLDEGYHRIQILKALNMRRPATITESF